MRNFLLSYWIAVFASSCSHPLNAPIVHATPNWQNLDLERDGVFGISTEKVYEELLNHKKARTTIVAVIDSGIDTTQAGLGPILWTDPADGSHGRNYIGPETGKEDFIPMLEAKRDDQDYRKTLDDYNLHVRRLENFIYQLKESKKILDRVVKNIGKVRLSPDDLKRYRPRDEDERGILGLVLNRMPAYPDFDRLRFYELDDLIERGQYHLEHGLKMGAAVEDRVGDGIRGDVSNDAEGLVAQSNGISEHGTMMAGIIAGARNNGKCINGISDHTRIMMLKLYNNIREMRNDALAPAIRFAVDNGARVISMSFGKTFSWHREAVDKAVQYAMSRGVLLVHSAGNNGMDLDVDGNSFFPSARYLDGGVAAAWITVGASGYVDDSTLAASFSNYGHKSVDVFAPGVQITSTSLHSGCATQDGTSEATPVVAGLAALIMEYYPALTAIQVKEIIMRTVTKRTSLKDKCISGGVVNAYAALKLAADYQ